MGASRLYAESAGAEYNHALPVSMLVDTSVWIDHFRRGGPTLVSLLNRAQVECHPFIIGELACGSLRRRSEMLSLLQSLPHVPAGSHGEVLAFVERHRLMSRGIGWIGAHLLAAVSLAGSLLWTRDRRFFEVARMLALCAQL